MGKKSFLNTPILGTDYTCADALILLASGAAGYATGYAIGHFVIKPLMESKAADLVGSVGSALSSGSDMCQGISLG